MEFFKKQFFGEGKSITLPELSEVQKADLATLINSGETLITYVNYCLKLSASRRFPYFTATAIDGNLFKKAPRKDSWRRDDRVAPEHQWGSELYKADKSDFDKGHMTKREDVQWGDSIAVASKAAESTFFYTNAVPQHSSLNQKIWRSLEDYILHTEARENGLRICVFTGPVLDKNDPFFVTPVNGINLQIPVLFWKVVVFPKKDGHLYRAGFLMSQATLLKKNKIVKESVREAISDLDQLFMSFEEADTYQVNILTIERLTRLTMPDALETYKDDRALKLILKEIDVRESLRESASITAQLGFDITGIVL